MKETHFPLPPQKQREEGRQVRELLETRAGWQQWHRRQGNLTCLVLLPVPRVPVAHKRAGVVLVQVQLGQHGLPVGEVQEGAGLALATKGPEIEVPTQPQG